MYPLFFCFLLFTFGDCSPKAMNNSSAEQQPDDPVRENCFVQGSWINELGSLMVLEQADDGTLTGEYGTAVEGKPGAKGPAMSPLRGVVHEDLVTFTVFFKGTNNQRSQTSWNGQCYEDCEAGQRTLRTTWILVRQKDSCSKAWDQNNIGQDAFRPVPVPK